MTYVCDTHAFVWHVAGGRRAGRAASRVLKRAEIGLDEVVITTVSLFEVALLIERGRLRAIAGWQVWLDTAQRTPGFRIEPLQPEDIAYAAGLSRLVDPFDRLIVGTALRLDASLITVDQRIAEAGVVDVVWD